MLFVAQRIVSLFPNRIVETVLFLLLRHIQFIFCNIGAGDAVLRIDGAAIQLLMRRLHKEKSVTDSALPGVMSDSKPLEHIGDIKIEHTVKMNSAAEHSRAVFVFKDNRCHPNSRFKRKIVRNFSSIQFLDPFRHFFSSEKFFCKVGKENFVPKSVLCEICKIHHRNLIEIEGVGTKVNVGFMNSERTIMWSCIAVPSGPKLIFGIGMEEKLHCHSLILSSPRSKSICSYSPQILKRLADELDICLLLVHHLRKPGDSDPFNKLTGTTGIVGAVDTAFVLNKSRRNANSATLYCTGRNVEDRQLELRFSKEEFVWKMLGDSMENREMLLPKEMEQLVNFMKVQKKTVATARSFASNITNTQDRRYRQEDSNG